jgi:hypothetical protein
MIPPVRVNVRAHSRPLNTPCFGARDKIAGGVSVRAVLIWDQPRSLTVPPPQLSDSQVARMCLRSVRASALPHELVLAQAVDCQVYARHAVVTACPRTRDGLGQRMQAPPTTP